MSDVVLVQIPEKTGLESASKKRRNRRKKLQSILLIDKEYSKKIISEENTAMSSKEEIIAAREAKKLAKQQAKNKNDSNGNAPKVTQIPKKEELTTPSATAKTAGKSPKSKDEVDRAGIKPVNIVNPEDPEKSRDQVKAERAGKKAAKQVKKKGVIESGDENPGQDMTVQDVVETLKDIVNVAKEMKEVTAKQPKESGKNIEEISKSKEESGKSKAELRAERRAKQEAQRAAKQTQEKKPAQTKTESEIKTKPASGDVAKVKEEKPIKQKTPDKQKAKLQKAPTINWFQHLQPDKDKEILKNIAINSNLHPAIVKLGVQLASRVVTGSNARCIAFLDALKKMVRDYSLPAKTEFGRGLESALTASVNFLWSARYPAASQANALKFFRYQLTQLPNNVDEFDAKKRLQEEIDRYILDQIETAGEAISYAVRQKIADGDKILTYGCSSLIERIFREAWQAGVRFRAVVVGSRARLAGEMLRRLAASGVPCEYYDITAVHFVMPTIQKVVLGASALLAHGGVVGAAGTAAVALAARAHNVPALVACETHKFSHCVRADAMDYTDAGNPDDLIDMNDENSPLKDWRSNPNLNLLNLTYDVTPPSLITAVVTELAILPCTSAPVVLRFKLSEYGI